jgi:hypothetical protein
VIALLDYRGTSTTTVPTAWYNASDNGPDEGTVARVWRVTVDSSAWQPEQVYWVEYQAPEPEDEALPCPEEPPPEVVPGWRPLWRATGLAWADCWVATPRARAPPGVAGQGGPARKRGRCVAYNRRGAMGESKSGAGVLASLCFAVAGMTVGAVSIAYTNYQAGVRDAQKAAIEAGAGEWTVDPKTGEKSFRYLGRGDR